MRKQAIPLHLVLNIHLHQVLWVFIKVRARYKNPILYNFNYERHSKELGVSHQCLRKYVQQMYDLGWCYLHHGNLCFRSLNKLKNHLTEKGRWKKSNCVLIPVRETKREQMAELRCAVLNRNLHQQKFMIQQRVETVKKCVRKQRLNPNEYKRIREVGGIENYEKLLLPYLTLSNKRIGILFNRSKYTGRRLQSVFRKMELIETTTKIKLVESNVKPNEVVHYRSWGTGYIYNPASMQLFKRLSNEIHTKH